jgi:hypothetical protein
MAARLLTALERAKDSYGEKCAAAKLALLSGLGRMRMRTAGEVMRLHEVLCFLRAYPDDAEVLAVVERMLARFHRRADLRQQRGRLADSGIAGTAIRYRFFWATACWFARRWPGLLQLDRDNVEAGQRIGAALPLLLTAPEAAALRQLDLLGFEAIDRIRNNAGVCVPAVIKLPGKLPQQQEEYWKAAMANPDYKIYANLYNMRSKI